LPSQDDKQEQRGAITHGNFDAFHRMKINNLKAELYMSKENRDSLKDELLALKKKLYTLEQKK